MIVARQKRKENIAEYILYMFQIEDLVRAFNFDLEEIEKSLINDYKEGYSVKREIREWYKSIITMMKDNNLESSGHIPMIKGLINSLNDIHTGLLKNENEKEYIILSASCRPAIEELRAKSGDPDKNDIEICLNGLYGLLMLKIQKKTINPETEKAFDNISKLIALLSMKFHEIEEGKKEI